MGKQCIRHFTSTLDDMTNPPMKQSVKNGSENLYERWAVCVPI